MLQSLRHERNVFNDCDRFFSLSFASATYIHRQFGGSNNTPTKAIIPSINSILSNENEHTLHEYEKTIKNYLCS